MSYTRLKLFIFILFSGISSNVALAVPSISFTLDSQHFSTAIAGGMTVGRYDLGQTFASTNLNFTNGYYTTENDNGYFNVEVKNPISNWSVTIDAWYVLANYQTPQTRSIVLTSENGESIAVSLKHDEVKFNNIVASQPNSYQRLAIELKQVGNDIQLYINASLVGTANRPSFGNLKFVNVQLIQERFSGGAGTNFYEDDLHGLIIGSQ